jgi:CHASE2 domain-containing sensor protein
MKARLQKLWPGLVGAALSASMGWFLVTTNFGLGLVHLSYDFPFVLRANITPSEAVIISLDEESGTRLEQPAGRAWDRGLHAKLLQRLTADRAKSVTYDIFFADPSPPDSPEGQKGDALFAEAIAQNGKVVLGANNVNLGYTPGSVTRGKRFDLPFEQILTNVANVASVEMNPDQDMIVREHIVYIDQIAPLAWATQAVDGVSKAVPEQYHDKLVLGVPAYGTNWVTSTTGTCRPEPSL